MEELLKLAADRTSGYMTTDLVLKTLEANLPGMMVFIDDQLRRAMIIIIFYWIFSLLGNIATLYLTH
jgi:hypothetical protein